MKVKEVVFINVADCWYLAGTRGSHRPGCVAAAETEAEVWKLIREAVLFHLEQMRLDGDPIPPPTSRADYVEVPEPASVA